MGRRMNRRELLAESLVVGGGLGARLAGADGQAVAHTPAGQESSHCFGIHVMDAQTGRGVPLVELRTVNNIRYYTDSAGYAAVEGTGLENKKTYFFVSSPGYEYPKDGFGYAGVALDLKPGASAIITIKRNNIAHRLYRITGEGIYRDSVMLGHPTPIRQPLLNGNVLGQDSVQAVIYRGKIHWIWGDTLQPAYPLGNFRSSGALSDVPGKGGLNPDVGINLRYFTDQKTGFCRAMCPLPDEPGGVVWLDGLTVIASKAGRELMVTRYGRYAGMTKLLDQGLALWDDQARIFRKYADFSSSETWRFPSGHPAVYRDGGVEYRLFCPQFGFPTARARADLAALADSDSYEGFTCLASGTAYRGVNSKMDRGPDGKIMWGWKRDTEPLDADQERKLLKAGLIKPHETHFQLTEAHTGQPLNIHGGSFFWNDYLKKWIMIAGQIGGTSLLGEIWFAQADAPTGPWTRAIKIATHPDYSFYNPTQHPFFDQQGGKIIYFEGTYSATFSGNAHPTPRYDYNQIMYGLDLSDPRLAGA